jgi:hypothetical protein
LCAKNLPATLPEREGWVEREALYDFSGRSRKPQIALAKAFGFDDYAQPAGGCCFLTDEQYSVKLADLWKSRGSRDYDLDDIMLLKVGRHLRPAPHYKVIISREEGEGRFLQGYRKRFVSLSVSSHPGPLALLDGEVNQSELLLVARLVARFSKGRDAEQVDVEISVPGEPVYIASVTPLRTHEIPQAWYL